MAKAWITEYQSAKGLSNELMQVPYKIVNEQTVTFTTSTQSTAFVTGANMIRIHADAACHYTIGSNPTATTDSIPLNATTTDFHGVDEGEKIALIAQ